VKFIRLLEEWHEGLGNSSTENDVQLFPYGVRKLCLRLLRQAQDAAEAKLPDSILVYKMKYPTSDNEVRDGSKFIVGILNDVMSLMVLFPLSNMA
jgi:hypothetical protein